jgi:hypothetical protein
MLTVVRRRLATIALAPVLVAACLDPNEDFDGPASTGTEASSTSDDGATVDGSTTTDGDTTLGGTSTDTSASCEPDGFEPNEEMEAAIDIGSYDVVLETADGIDRYNMFFDTPPAEFQMSADADVRACAFVACEGTFDPPDVQCAIGLEGSNEGGNLGCCGGPALAMTYVCATDMGAKLHLAVDQAPADCTFYTLEIATLP